MFHNGGGNGHGHGHGHGSASIGREKDERELIMTVDEDTNTAAAAANALIDSYFLPGGILDPEEMNNNQRQAQGQAQDHEQHSTRMVDSSNDPQDTDVINTVGGYGDVAAAATTSAALNKNDTMGISRSRLDRAVGGASLEQQLQGVEYPAPDRVGVAALDPSSDDVVGGMPIFGNNKAKELGLGVGGFGGHGQGHLHQSSQASHGRLRHTGNIEFGQSHQSASLNPNAKTEPNLSTSWFTEPANSTGAASNHNDHINLFQTTQRDIRLNGGATDEAENVDHENYELSDLLGALHHQSTPIAMSMPMSMPVQVQSSNYSSSNESQSRTTSVAATQLHHNNPWNNDTTTHKPEKVPSSNSLKFTSSGLVGSGSHFPGMGGPGPIGSVNNNGAAVSGNAGVGVGRKTTTLPRPPVSLGMQVFPRDSSSPSISIHQNQLGSGSASSLVGLRSPASAPAPVAVSSQAAAMSSIPQSVRPPPGFSSSSPPAVSNTLSSHGHGPSAGHASVQQQPQPRASLSIVDHHDRRVNMTSMQMPSAGRFQNTPHEHQNSMLQHIHSRSSAIVNAVSQHQQEHPIQHPHQHQQALLHHHPHHSYRKKHPPHQHVHDGDYDLSSINSKSSRDVPSTIYLRQPSDGDGNNDDDAVSNSEDLTVCADSVTVASLPVNKVENEPMDVLEETSAQEVSKCSALYAMSYDTPLASFEGAIELYPETCIDGFVD